MRDGDLTRRGDTSAQRRGGRPSDGFWRASRPLLPGRRPGAVGTEPRPEQPRRRSGEAARHPRNHAIGMRRGDHGASTSPSLLAPSAVRAARSPSSRRTAIHPPFGDIRRATLRRSPDARSSPPPPPSLQAATAAALIVTVWTARTRTLQDLWRPVPGFDLDATFDAGDAPGGRLVRLPPPRAPSPPTSSPPPNHDSASAKRAKRARRTSRDSAVFLSPRRSSTSTTTSTARTSPWRSARGRPLREATSTPSASRLRLPSSTRCCLIPGAP